MSKRAASSVTDAQQPVAAEPPAAEKQVESIPLDTIVIAYLESQLAKLRHDLAHKEEDMKKAEINMVAQMQRFMGQREGEIEALKQQITGIEQQLNPTEVAPPQGSVTA